jgi:hypothetical protein
MGPQPGAPRRAGPRRPPAPPPRPAPAPAPQSFLGFFIMLLVVAYHYVTADPKFEQSQ